MADLPAESMPEALRYLMDCAAVEARAIASHRAALSPAPQGHSRMEMGTDVEASSGLDASSRLETAPELDGVPTAKKSRLEASPPPAKPCVSAPTTPDSTSTDDNAMHDYVHA